VRPYSASSCRFGVMRSACSDREICDRSRLAPGLFVSCALFLGTSVTLGAGCGSAPPPPPVSDASKPAAADAAPKEKAAEKADAAPKVLPTTCTPGADGLCAPPEDFVKRLCGGSFPDVALVMFAKDTPWSRGYLRRAMDAWSASGGKSSNEKTQVDDEVLLLVHRVPDTGGMSVSGSSGGGYEALRWDGTCVSLMAEEVTTRLPAKAKAAKIPWKDLDLKTREALSADEKVGPFVAEYRKECKGGFGEVTPKCEKADKKLAQGIVDYVRGGGALPAPSAIP
jgi:hypothetical protein